MKENRHINDRIRKASPTDVSWWISIHGLSHLGLRQPTVRQYWVCACAICGYNKSRVASLGQETRVSWPREMVGSDIITISTFTRLGHGGPGMAARARRLNTERRELPGMVHRQPVPAVTVHRRPCPSRATGLRSCTSAEYRQKSRDHKPVGVHRRSQGAPSYVREGHAPAELPDSGGVLPQARPLNTERKAARGHHGALRRPELSSTVPHSRRALRPPCTGRRIVINPRAHESAPPESGSCV